MLTNRERLARDRMQPWIMKLDRALSRLTSVITVMNTGAHPDDEHSGMLGLLRFHFGMRVVVACSTRGEGGQNGLGRERGGALGVLRTREMEEAAREIDADVAWLGHGPDDPVHDFGFSKSGEDTLNRWGEERIVERLVRAYREYRPDIVIPTFLDVPGQHGHHRAMTRAAEKALAAAAEPGALQEHLSEGLRPWNVKKYYLPAWSGGGGTYDDELPPPPATLTLRAPGCDAVTGASYDRIGQFSRRFHASQGMGLWRDNPRMEWALHLAAGAAYGGQAEHSISDGLPADLGQLALADEVMPDLAGALRTADAAIRRAQAAFPDAKAIIPPLVEAGRALEQALAVSTEPFLSAHGHRLTRKIREIDAALAIAAGLNVSAVAEPPFLTPGGTASLTARLAPGLSCDVTVETVLPKGVAAEPLAAPTQGAADFMLKAEGAAPLSPQYTPRWSNLGGNSPVSLSIEACVGGRQIAILADPEEAVAVEPMRSPHLEPDAIIVRRRSGVREWTLTFAGGDPAEDMSLDLPAGWRAGALGRTVRLEAPADPAPGEYEFGVLMGGRQAYRADRFRYDHIGDGRCFRPSKVRALALDLELPENARIGYIGGGADRVGIWLKRMGLTVDDLDADSLARAIADDLRQFTTIVVGIFAFGLRPDLLAARPVFHRFVENGGNLVTLYHRPGDGWDPEATPPEYLAIGSPSVRYRVTDAQAPVTVLKPEHKLFEGPNAIREEDWQGWRKERGLYFAAKFAPSYQPLVAMADPGEKPLDGGLLSASIGLGRHTHIALALHHQLDCLVPGAFRLMANLVQPEV